MRTFGLVSTVLSRIQVKRSSSSGRKKVANPTAKIDKAKEVEEEERAKLAELKEVLGDALPPQIQILHRSYTDDILLSILRARSLNVKDAARLYVTDKNMRRFLRLDEFLSDLNLPQIKLNLKYSVSGTIGFDKEGTLVRVINVGYSDAKGFITCLPTMDHFKLYIWFIERDIALQRAQNLKTGLKSERITYILNMEHLSLTKLMDKSTIEAGLLALKLLQDHYQDIEKVVYIVNAPSYFNSSIIKLFKPVIKENLNQRLKVLDKDDILEYIDADVLPTYLGGNRVDSNGDPDCKELIGFGGTIDDEYYPTNFLSSEDPGVECVTVPAGSAVCLRYKVTEVGSTLNWHIQTKENDLGIAVFLDKNEEEQEANDGSHKKKKDVDVSKLEPLTPYIRSQCQLIPETGITTAWFTGTVVLQLDNSYSWMSAKEAIVRVTVDPPVKKSNNKNEKKK